MYAQTDRLSPRAPVGAKNCCRSQLASRDMGSRSRLRDHGLCGSDWWYKKKTLNYYTLVDGWVVKPNTNPISGSSFDVWRTFDPELDKNTKLVLPESQLFLHCITSFWVHLFPYCLGFPDSRSSNFCWILTPDADIRQRTRWCQPQPSCGVWADRLVSASNINQLISHILGKICPKLL